MRIAAHRKARAQPLDETALKEKNNNKKREKQNGMTRHMMRK